MPLPKNRSRCSIKRKYKKTPTGNNVIHYKRKIKNKKHSCAICKKLLQAVNSKRKSSLSSKRPNRIFAGHLCHICTQKAIKYASDLKSKEINEADVEILFRKYVEAIVSKI